MSTETAPKNAGDMAKRRGQALGGAAAGVVILIVLVVVFIIVKAGKSDKSPVAGSAPSASAPGAAPSQAAPSQEAPVSVNTPAALAKEPEVKAGGKKPLTKLVIVPIVKGTGPVVRKGQTLTANYKLVSYKTGEVIDSSWGRGPYVTEIGVGKVIPGWDQGLVGQKIGSRLQLDVPAALGEGDQLGDLRFVVDLLAVQ